MRKDGSSNSLPFRQDLLASMSQGIVAMFLFADQVEPLPRATAKVRNGAQPICATWLRRWSRAKPRGVEITMAAALASAGLPLAVVHPRPIRDFARATLRRAKTDPRARVPIKWTHLIDKDAAQNQTVGACPHKTSDISDV